MSDILYRTASNLTLIGAGGVTANQLDHSLALAPELIAADGGADQAKEFGHSVLSVIGDLDSLTNDEYWQKSGTSVNRIAEQSTTDFEKCLYSVEASLIIGVGFMDGRADHQLAAFSALLRFSHKKVILLGQCDICFLCPPELSLQLPPATRLSLFPLAPLTGIRSSGLKWPIEDLTLAPGKAIGTSNQTVSTEVEIAFDAPGMLTLLPPEHLEASVLALTNARNWQ